MPNPKLKIFWSVMDWTSILEQDGDKYWLNFFSWTWKDVNGLDF
jgi:hypothetical protein